VIGHAVLSLAICCAGSLMPFGVRAQLAQGGNAKKAAAGQPPDPEELIRTGNHLREQGRSEYWTTDESALLGVKDGNPMAFLRAIAPRSTTYAWVGLADDWTTGETCDHCNGTGSGRAMQLGASAIQTKLVNCSARDLVLICVEQSSGRVRFSQHGAAASTR